MDNVDSIRLPFGDINFDRDDMDVKGTTRDWSSLPFDILSEVALKLGTIEDFVYFSTVCHAWKYASSLVKLKWCSRIPWLLLAENTKNNDEHVRKLFSLNRTRCYELKLPQTFGARCWGSSCGWIVMIELNLNISLFNPLTQVQIFLPPQPTLPYQLPEFPVEWDAMEYRWLRNYFLYKVFVLKLADNELLVVAIHRYDKRVAFARPGDERWTPVITLDKDAVEVISWADDKMLIMYVDGALGYCDLNRVDTLEPLKAMEFSPSPCPFIDRSIIGFCSCSIYMVDSFGDLVRVIRHKAYVRDKKKYFETTSFQVLKLNFETKEWEQIEDLGDYSIFVGENCSMLIPASLSSNIKCNCIYFTDDEYGLWNSVSFYGPHDLGVFELKSKEFTIFYNGGDIRSKFCTPIWFIPTF